VQQRALLSGLVLGALFVLVGPVGAADVVKLKDGRVLEGTVSDHGSYLIVTFSGAGGATGRLRIKRAEVLSIELDGELKRTRDELDIVVLLSGDEIAGRVEIRKDGREVAIVRNHGELVLDQRQVKAILWSHRAEAEQKMASGGGIGRTIEKLLTQIEEGDPEARSQARRKLIDLGVFALVYLETRSQREAAPEVTTVIHEVLEVARARSFMTGFLVERHPDLAERLAAADRDTRLDALKDAVEAGPEDAAPLLLHVVKREQTAEVRAYVLGQLTVMNRIDELVELLQSNDVTLQFAAALALGDNGVYVGMTLIIDALAHKESAVREVAIAALERWTGQFLGFFVGDDEAKRNQAIARWKSWYAKHGEAFVQTSIRATVRRDLISEDDKTEGRAYWTSAHLLWSKVVSDGDLRGEARKDELRKVQFYLRKAIGKFPHFPNARLALAELYYTEFGEYANARRELGIVLHRYPDELSREGRQTGYYHLGQVARLEKLWIEADRHLRTAGSFDPTDYRTHRALGRLSYERSLEDPELVRARREQELTASGAAFTEALKRLRAYAAKVERSQNKLNDAADGEAESDQPFRRGRLVARLSDMKAQLVQEEAELHFLRARSHAALGKDVEAYDDYVAAATLEPDNAVYSRAVEIWRPRAQTEAPETASDGSN
jgi:tetratricopeptide (TPR) repeat protein